METAIIGITLFLEFLIIKKRLQNAALVLIVIYCLIPINLGLNWGMRFNIITLSVGCYIFLTFSMYEKKVCIDRKFDRLLKIYGVYVVVTSIIGSFVSGYINEYVKNILAFGVNFIFVGLFANHIKLEKKDFNTINIVLIVLVFIIGGYGLLNYSIKINPYIAFISLITDSNDMSNTFLEEERGFLDGRVSSTFIHPLLLGQVSIIFFSYILYAFNQGLTRYFRVICLIILVLMCLLCGSRSALIPLVVAIVIYILYNKNNKRWTIIKYVCVWTVILPFFYFSLSQHYQESINGFVIFWDDSYAEEANIKGSSFEMRLQQFENGLYIIRDSPLLGFGQGYVSMHGDKHGEMLGYESFVFQFLIDGGLIGIVAFTFFYIALYMNLLKKCKRKYDKGRVHVLCLTYFINILFTGIQSGTFIVFIIFYYFIDNHLRKRDDTQNHTLLLA